MMNLGQFLSMKREAMKWTRQQVADSMGKTYQKIYSWETSKYLPKEEELKDVCKYYGFSMSELKAQFEEYKEIKDSSLILKNQHGGDVEVMISPYVPDISNEIKLSTNAFPLDVLKSRLDLAVQITVNIDGPEGDGAWKAYDVVLEWIAELEGKELA